MFYILFFPILFQLVSLVSFSLVLKASRLLFLIQEQKLALEWNFLKWFVIVVFMTFVHVSERQFLLHRVAPKLPLNATEKNKFSQNVQKLGFFEKQIWAQQETFICVRNR